MASKADRLKSKIFDAIKSSPQLKPGNYISVAVKHAGLPIFSPLRIELSGRAASDKDKAAIEQIAQGLAEGLEVVSYVRTGRAG